jgi:hypothetical protein
MHQVIVLTHIGATPEETFPYAASLFAGTPVVTVYGRHAASAPTVAPRKCVHFGWRDVLLPLMQDSEFPEDTIFFVFEEDWRLHAAAEEVEQRFQQAEVATATAHQSSTGAGSSTDAPVDWTQKPNSRTLPVPQKGVRDTSTALKDLVAIANQADREDMGDIIWFSWQSRAKGTGKWPARPTYGSTFLAFNKKAARWTHRVMLAQGKQAELHFDCWLVGVLYKEVEKDVAAQQVRASFVRPTIGCFIEHTSGCQPNIGRRQSQWDLKHVGEGTRDEGVPDHERRTLVRWPRYSTPGNREFKVWLQDGDQPDAWWKSATTDARVLAMMKPAWFRLGQWVPKAADGLHDTWAQSKYVVTKSMLAAFHTTLQETKRASRRRRPVESNSAASADAGPQPPKPTERMRRNYRKFFAASTLNRVWVKDMVACLICMQNRGCTTEEPSAFCSSLVKEYCMHVSCGNTKAIADSTDATSQWQTRTSSSPDWGRGFRMPEVSVFTFELFTAQMASPEATTEDDGEMFFSADEDEEAPKRTSSAESIDAANVVTIEESRAAKRARLDEDTQLSSTQVWNLLLPSIPDCMGE